MQITADRISRHIEAIAGFSECPPTIGYSRPTFTHAWRQSRDYVIEQAKAAGCKVRVDAAGNVHARPELIPWDQPVWLSGSHIDSVPTGGKFDGVIGIVAPLEVLRAAHENNQQIPLELMIFAEEEGSTFGIGMIGSRLWVDPQSAESFQKFKNRDSQDFFQAGAPHGVRPGSLESERLNPAHYRGLIEIHIEQGPAMWERGERIAIVTAIAGRKQYKVKLIGVSNHAGSTPMTYRKDALVAAARVIVGVDAMAWEMGRGIVATVGKISCEPNAINVIPGTAHFTIDVRGPDQKYLDLSGNRLEFLVNDCELDEVEFITTENQSPILMDKAICDALCKANDSRRIETISGALHDAAIIAPLIPTAMLFVASKGGTSHNPAEFSRIEDIAAAANVLAKVVELEEK